MISRSESSVPVGHFVVISRYKFTHTSSVLATRILLKAAMLLGRTTLISNGVLYSDSSKHGNTLRTLLSRSCNAATVLKRSSSIQNMATIIMKNTADVGMPSDRRLMTLKESRRIGDWNRCEIMVSVDPFRILLINRKYDNITFRHLGLCV